MQVLKHGDNSPEVRQLQETLNATGPTRLPRLAINSAFDAATMARVMEFQFRNGLPANGVFGPQTNEKLTAEAQLGNPSEPEGRCIRVDLFGQELTAFEKGLPAMHISPVAGGRPGYRSTVGVFRMTSRRLRHHSSSEFPGKDNMAFAMFYHEGEAIHQGNPNVQSHGCIHVGAPHAEELFEWAGETDIWVIVER
jgi:lipoprotein-anchoring transpeptidase ErfK/SrfK